ncbi:hypothetical protein JIX56_22035 [Streptomyces sp. CA-210063]|uniref:hypothetical protein n=1 Tax=Streptomyces sp. CA-210063 TaxID=2801029 RepID=UPI00214AB50E|nr:hypothetical protein [Streptomyces sp. CA-210063]UUU32364.1 hypothetical protein JIX56_22035 [Streptomyces sp. CA-210063]
MRSARMLMATAATSAVLALGAPVAYAVEDDGDHTDSSYSKEQDKEQDSEKEYDKEKDAEKEYGKEKEHGKEHDGPRGGMHTGGGALTTVNEDDWTKEDSETSKEDSETSKDSTKGDEGSWTGKHKKPHGGVHTGGGALTTLNEDDWSKQDSETSKDGAHSEDSWSGKQDESAGGEKHDENGWSGKHEKPSGGVHTGGGALASPTMTAGGLAVLTVAAGALYAARRKKSAGSVA